MRWTLAILGATAVFSASSTVHLFTGVPAVAIDGPLVVAASVFLWKRSREEKAPAAGRTIFFAACAVAAAALIDHIARYPDGGNDAFIIWNLRARWLFRAGADFRSAFSPEILFWTHQDYPLLLPGLVARGFALLGHESRAVPAVAAVLFTACPVAIVVAAAPAGKRWWAGLAMVTTPALVMLGATEQADLPLAAFTGAAIAILIVRKPGDLRALAAAGAFASMAAWTKNEGLLHAALIASAVALTERKLSSLLAFLGGALPFLALLAAFKLAYAPSNDLVHGLSLSRALSLDRWWTLFLLTLRRIVLLQAWGLHLLALVVWAVFARKWSAAPPSLRWLTWFPLATMVVHLGILLMQPHDLTFMFKVTIDRLLIQLWPSIVLLISHREAS